jgi:hypothetical protein
VSSAKFASAQRDNTDAARFFFEDDRTRCAGVPMRWARDEQSSAAAYAATSASGLSRRVGLTKNHAKAHTNATAAAT